MNVKTPNTRKTMTIVVVCLGIFILGISLLIFKVFNSEEIAENDKIVASANGSDILLSEINEHILILSKQQKAQPRFFQNLTEDDKERIIKQVALKKVLTEEALDSDVVEMKKFKKQIQKVKEELARKYYLEEKGKELVNEEEIETFYNNSLEKIKGKKEAKIRHILVSSKDAANKVIKDLSSSSFEKLAVEKSIDRASGVKGGDLGFVLETQMEDELKKVVFAMQPGEISKPVKTKFGWHVVKLEGVRDAVPLPVEEIEDNIRSVLAPKALQQYTAEVLDDLEIEIYEDEEDDDDGDDE